MVRGCGANCSKFLVFFFNFLAFLAGLGILIACVVVYTNNSIEKELLENLPKIEIPASYQSMRNVWIAGMIIGGIILLLGFLGCCGAATESQTLLIIFGLCMIALVVAQLVVGGLIFTKRNEIKSDLSSDLNKTANHAENKTDEICTAFLDWAKDAKFNCCGIENPHLDTTCDLNLSCEQTSKNRCDDKIWNAFVSMSGIVGAIVLAIILLEVAALTFACCLCCSIRRGENLYEQFA